MKRWIESLYMGPRFLEDFKWFQMLLGVTNQLRISAAASQLMRAYVIAFTDRQSAKVPPL